MLTVRKIAPSSAVYMDFYRSYNALNVSDFHHERVSHSALFATGNNHIDSTEGFRNHTRRVLRKYNRISKESFPLFPGESEHRFNYATSKQQLKTLNKWTEI